MVVVGKSGLDTLASLEEEQRSLYGVDRCLRRELDKAMVDVKEGYDEGIAAAATSQVQEELDALLVACKWQPC